MNNIYELIIILFSQNLSLSDTSNRTDQDFCAVFLSLESDGASSGKAENAERRQTGGTN